MLELIAFCLIASTLAGIVFWLVHNTNQYERKRREAPQKRKEARQAELWRKLQNSTTGKGLND